MKKEYLVSAKEMKQLDDNTINKTGIPSLVLMERASLAVADCVRKYLAGDVTKPILVVAGNGNNGADGVCAARILTEFGYSVDIYLLQSGRDDTEELKLQKKIAKSYGICFLQDEIDYMRYAVIVDAIFGVGLNRDVEGKAADIIGNINVSDAYIISVDIPSGINASTGEVCAVAVKADETVTFGFYKSGQIFFPGREYCGKISKACIGIDETSFYGDKPRMFSYMCDFGERVDLDRDVAGNKGTFGKVLIVAGRDTTAGAAVLCASSALRSGCGMVTVFTEESNKEALLLSLPEAMTEIYTDSTDDEILIDKLDKWLSWADVCVIGCGLNKDETAYRLVSHVFSSYDKPVIADADALHLLANNEQLKEMVYSRRKDVRKAPVVITPHPGELAKLAHCSITDVKKNRMELASKVCKEYGVILVAKDADTLCMADEECMYLNVSGNDGMATAGSGDVLAGLTGAFVARAMRDKQDIFEAICLAVYIHGLAGDFQTKKNGKSYMVASDMIEAYKYILK